MLLDQFQYLNNIRNDSFITEIRPHFLGTSFKFIVNYNFKVDKRTNLFIFFSTLSKGITRKVIKIVM